MDIREVVERGMGSYPADRDLHRFARQLTAAEKSGKPTKPIAEKITTRLNILKTGGKHPTDSPECRI